MLLTVCEVSPHHLRSVCRAASVILIIPMQWGSWRLNVLLYVTWLTELRSAEFRPSVLANTLHRQTVLREYASVHVCMYMHVCAYTHVSVHVHVYTHVRVHVCMRVCACTHM